MKEVKRAEVLVRGSEEKKEVGLKWIDYLQILKMARFTGMIESDYALVIIILDRREGKLLEVRGISSEQNSKAAEAK